MCFALRSCKQKDRPCAPSQSLVHYRPLDVNWPLGLICMAKPTSPPQYKLVLDPTLYNLKDDEKAFFKQLTGIKDEDKLKEHALNIQREAFAIHPYPCIHGFRFLSMKISRLPAYKDVIALGQNRKGAILLDLGCCFGNDPRKAVADGFPAEQVVASDLEPEFWELGHKLFKDDPSTLPITFIPGDIFDDNFIKAGAPFPTLKQGAEPFTSPSLKALYLTNSLNPLTGKVSAIHTSFFFHLFDEPLQLTIARKLASLLSPEPGSIIFGNHVGTRSAVKGTAEENVHGMTRARFRHSKDSFKEMWEREVFKDGEVVCDTSHSEPRPEDGFFIIIWSVKRL